MLHFTSRSHLLNSWVLQWLPNPPPVKSASICDSPTSINRKLTPASHVMWNSIRLQNRNSHSQVFTRHTHTHTCALLKIHAWRLGLRWGWSHHHGDKHTFAHTHIRSIFTQPVLPALTGRGDEGVMASSRADVQLGMWDVQAGIPGKAQSLGKECHIDREVWIGSPQYVCYGGHPSGFRQVQFWNIVSVNRQNLEPDARCPSLWDHPCFILYQIV